MLIRIKLWFGTFLWTLGFQVVRWHTLLISDLSMAARFWYQLHERTMCANLLGLRLVKQRTDRHGMVPGFVSDIMLVKSRAADSFLGFVLQGCRQGVEGVRGHFAVLCFTLAIKSCCLAPLVIVERDHCFAPIDTGRMRERHDSLAVAQQCLWPCPRHSEWRRFPRLFISRQRICIWSVKLSKASGCVSSANRAVALESGSLWRSESLRWCVDIAFVWWKNKIFNRRAGELS